MKGIFLGFSGHAYAEDVSAYKRFIEFEGGDYLVSKDSVLNDVEHKIDSIMLTRQGVSSPDGDDIVREAVHESDRLKLHEHRVQRDKMLPRRFFRSLYNLVSVMAVVCTSITIYLLIWVFTWAWFHVWLPI
jgi:hypothetical protein